MNRYEAVIVYNPNLTDVDIAQHKSQIESVVSSHGGTFERYDIWGRKELAYPVKKFEHGIYVVMVFTGDKGIVSDLSRQLRINEAVIRQLVVEKDQYAPDFSLERLDSSAKIDENLPPVATDDAVEASV